MKSFSLALAVASTIGASIATSDPSSAWASAKIKVIRLPSYDPYSSLNLIPIKAQATVKKLSVADKATLATGIGWGNGTCVGNTGAIPKISFPGFCLQDSPLGVRFGGSSSLFPAGINTAATWNRDLMLQRGIALGAEFKGVGVNVALGPDVNIARTPTSGRNWEGFGGDPYLSGEAAFQTVTGMQSSGVQACAKHFINNEQEHQRSEESSNVDDRTEHEVYLHPFLKAVQAGVASVMCSYNQENNTYSCENNHSLNQLLKTELGFEGFVTTDWWVNEPKYGTEAANQGLDMVMPGGAAYGETISYFGPALVSAVQAGLVPESRLDDMATRILSSWYLLGQDKNYPPVNLNATVQGNHKTLIRQIGAASTVLLKNSNKALPLVSPSSIAVIGNDAGSNPAGPNSCTDRSCDVGILAVGWGSGSANFPYLVDPLSAIKAHVPKIPIRSSLNDTDLTAAQQAAKGASVALVFINSDSGEDYITVEGNEGDRNTMAAWHGGDALVEAVASVNKNTIVVVNSVGPLIMESWINNPNVTALVWAGLQGQEAGNAIVDVLWGTVNPSGKLPYTIAKQQRDYPAQVIVAGGNITYSEGLFVDYKWFDAKGIAPRYEFGFGLSYTTFQYSKLHISVSTISIGGSAPSGLAPSLSSWLHDDWFSVSFQIKNTGNRAGTEIPQLYLVAPKSAQSPPNQLRGFSNVNLQPGQTGPISLALSRYSFAIWSVTAQKWVIPTGTYGIWIGSSSRAPQLTGSVTIKN
ncbi:hypothetical protein FRB95_000985 [Tulasnella sp. JGI-2019a]|nr:hypothetical protein FRB95_000985 [Tulasnella sp. JGI-2019a]